MSAEVAFAVLKAPFVIVYEMIRALWYNFTDGLFIPCNDLRGKRVLLTGASMGLGREIALILARKGVELVLWDVEEKGLDETAKMCRHNGVKVHTRKVDLNSRSDIDGAANALKEGTGEPDIVINNAGIGNQRYFTDKKDHLIESTIRVNLMAHFWILRAFLPTMLRRDKGHVVSIASAAGLFGCSGMADYSASKSGAIALQEALEAECQVLGKNGVKFTTVCPGYIETRLTTKENIPAASTKELVPVPTAAKRIVRAIQQEQGLLIFPKVFYFIHAIKGLIPRRLFQRLLVQLLWKEQQDANTCFVYNTQARLMNGGMHGAKGH